MSPSLDYVLSMLIQVYTPNDPFFYIFVTISRFPKLCLSFRFSDQNCVCNSHLLHTCPTHITSGFNHPNNIRRAVNTAQFIIVKLLRTSVISSFVDPNIYICSSFSNILNPCFPLICDIESMWQNLKENFIQHSFTLTLLCVRFAQTTFNLTNKFYSLLSLLHVIWSPHVRSNALSQISFLYPRQQSVLSIERLRHHQYAH